MLIVSSAGTVASAGNFQQIKLFIVDNKLIHDLQRGRRIDVVV